MQRVQIIFTLTGSVNKNGSGCEALREGRQRRRKSGAALARTHHDGFDLFLSKFQTPLLAAEAARGSRFIRCAAQLEQLSIQTKNMS